MVHSTNYLCLFISLSRLKDRLHVLQSTSCLTHTVCLMAAILVVLTVSSVKSAPRGRMCGGFTILLVFIQIDISQVLADYIRPPPFQSTSKRGCMWQPSKQCHLMYCVIWFAGHSNLGLLILSKTVALLHHRLLISFIVMCCAHFCLLVICSMARIQQ